MKSSDFLCNVKPALVCGINCSSKNLKNCIVYDHLINIFLPKEDV